MKMEIQTQLFRDPSPDDGKMKFREDDEETSLMLGAEDSSDEMFPTSGHGWDVHSSSSSFRLYRMGSSDDNSSVGSTQPSSTIRRRRRSSEVQLVPHTSPSRLSRDAFLADLTINQLKIDSTRLIGREQEASQLLSCYDRMVDGHDTAGNATGLRQVESYNSLSMSLSGSLSESLSTSKQKPFAMARFKKELVLISGLSGVGKSSVARTLKMKSMFPETAAFVEGKFDLNNTTEPYSGISKALGTMCRMIKDEMKDSLQLVSTKIFEALGDNVDVLADLIPELKLMLDLSCKKPKVQFPPTGIDQSFNDDEARPKGKGSQMAFHSSLAILDLSNRESTRSRSKGKSPSIVFNDSFNFLDSSIRKSISSRRDDKQASKSSVLQNRNPRSLSMNFNRSNNEQEPAKFASYNVQSGQETVKYAFRVLVRVLTSLFPATIFMLDNLQWADVSSLEVIRYLITDRKNQIPLMIVGCYRSDKALDDHRLPQMIGRLRSEEAKWNFNVTEMEVQSCNVEVVNQIIMEMMSIDDSSETHDLAVLCHQKTLGNPHYLIEFMSMLHREELISFNLGLLKWTYDVSAIHAATMSTTNVADLLEVRIRQLPEEVQLFLQYAACLGSSFKASIMQRIWNNKGGSAQTESIENFLETSICSNIIERCGRARFRWVHDKVQEAALALSGSNSDQFQFSVGVLLLRLLGNDDLEDHLFEVTDLINNNCDAKDYPQYANLNLKAALKARRISALHSAREFAAVGISMLQGDISEELDLYVALQLYTIGAEMELAVGNVDTAESYSKMLLDSDKYSTMEKLPLRIAQVTKMCYCDGNLTGVIDECTTLLKDLRFRLLWKGVPRPAQAVAMLMRTISKSKKVHCDTSDIGKSLGPMVDERDRRIVAIIGVLSYAAFQAGDQYLYLIGMCKILQMTFEKGITDESGICLTALGLLTVAIRKDFETAFRFAEMGLEMQTVSNPIREGGNVFTANSYVFPWKQPLQTCLKSISEGYISSMAVGDSAYATWSLLSSHVWLPWIMGKPLRPMLAEFPVLESQMEDLVQPEQLFFLRAQWQVIANLTTATTKPSSKLVGGIVGQESLVGRSGTQKGIIHFAEGELLLFLDTEAAAERAARVGNKFEKLIPSICLIMIETFHRGVALYALARRTKKRKYRVEANRIRNTIKSWLMKGNPNVQHYRCLLNAEQAVLVGEDAKASRFYAEAISLAARTGHLHHAALANERYADFLHTELGDIDQSAYFLKEAIRFYEAWGAMAKVEVLNSLLSELTTARSF
ncbi:MAG: hypothetical protein SGBAC_010629 [Bacillariaceae sp.]